MTASVESIIAAALAGHQPLISVDYPTGLVTAVACDCDTIYRDLTTHAAHQAAAVMTALQEAGNVEWGTLGDVGQGSTVYEWSTKESASYYTQKYEGIYVVSRPTLPWQEVEE